MELVLMVFGFICLGWDTSVSLTTNPNYYRTPSCQDTILKPDFGTATRT